MSLRHARKSFELGAIAMQRHDQRAVCDRARIDFAPQSKSAQAKLAHHDLRGLLLAIRGKHSAGVETAPVHEGHGRALVQRNLVPVARQRQRLPETDDSGAANGNGLGLRHDWKLVAQCDAFAAWVGAALEAIRRDGDYGKAAGEVETLDLVTELAHAVGERVPLFSRLKKKGTVG